jgi:hypothetical protein
MTAAVALSVCLAVKKNLKFTTLTSICSSVGFTLLTCFCMKQLFTFLFHALLQIISAYFSYAKSNTVIQGELHFCFSSHYTVTYLLEGVRTFHVKFLNAVVN